MRVYNTKVRLIDGRIRAYNIKMSTTDILMKWTYIRTKACSCRIE